MKNYITIIAIVLLVFTSCDDPDTIVFDSENGQALAQILNGAVQTLPVPDSGDTAIIEVGVSTVSTSDRAISISIDPASTAAPAEYTIDMSTLVIPAGSFVGRIMVSANFDAIPETGLTSLIINVDDVAGSDVLEGTLSHTINLFRFCPFTNGATFTGDYMLETVVLGIFGVTTLTDGVVSISEGATVADRTFDVSAYPAFGAFAAFSYNFSLICDEIVVGAVDDVNVGCGGNNAIGPSSATVSSYSEGDDSEILITFVDDVRGQCDGPHEVTIRLTKM